MGYLHINNLYKAQEILLFKRAFALEKIHGSSAHLSFKNNNLAFFSGGASHESFLALFDKEKLAKLFEESFLNMDVTVYGEVYGGKMQKMSHTYGPNLKFIVFDVYINDCWLSVPRAENIAHRLEQEFVHYVEIDTTIEAMDDQKNADSVQAIRNGMGPGHKREGIVLRPLIEVTMNNGERVISKYKVEDFNERQNTPKVVDAGKATVLTEASKIADEWVVPMRLEHVLQGLPNASGIEHTGEIIKAMVADIYREAKGEIVESKDVSSAIGKKTVELWKAYIKAKAKL